MRRMMQALVTLALLAPAGASAQATGDAAADARISAAIEKALTVGVPEAVLERKVAEGRAKGVAAARIAAAVEHRASVLMRVQAALESRTRAVEEGELVAAADAHERGVSVQAISKLSAQSGNDRAQALSVLADLVASGKAPEHALLRVEAALGGGASELAKLRSTTGAAVRATLPPRGNSRPQGGETSTTARATTRVRVGG